MNNETLRCVVIEDEDTLRQTLIRKLNQHHTVEVVGEASSVMKAFSEIILKQPDFIFLDIVLIEGDAFSLIELLVSHGIHIPPIILNTGYSDFKYAKKIADNYKSNIIHLLEKPFYELWDEHLAIIINKVNLIKKEEEKNIQFISVLEEGVIHKINLNELESIKVPLKGSGKIILCITNPQLKIEDRFFEVNMTIKKISLKLPSSFIQISRDVLINGILIKKYNKVEKTITLMSSDEEFYVSDHYKEGVARYLNGN